MSVLETVRKRRSIRSYRNKPIPEDLLRNILEAARLAPSARNRQEWRFIVVRDREIKKKVVEGTNHQDFADSAPVILVFCATEDSYMMRCGQKAGSVDTSIAMSYVTLAAADLGLGTCWLGSFYEDKIKAVLGVPAEARIVAVTPLGYPAEDPSPTPRKKYEEVVSFDRW